MFGQKYVYNRRRHQRLHLNGNDPAALKLPTPEFHLVIAGAGEMNKVLLAWVPYTGCVIYRAPGARISALLISPTLFGHDRETDVEEKAVNNNVL